jgi:hypothetical protein
MPKLHKVFAQDKYTSWIYKIVLQKTSVLVKIEQCFAQDKNLVHQTKVK